MARTRITITDDVSVPKVLALAGGITWYAYLRGGAQLCIQRAVAGVREAEFPVCSPVEWFDAEVDPDLTRAWIYVLHDGVMQALQVTNLVSDPVNAAALVRNVAWYEGVSRLGAGVPVRVWDLVDRPPIKFNLADPVDPLGSGYPSVAFATSEGPDAPTVAIEAPYGDPFRVLVVTLPNRTTVRNRRITHIRVSWRESTAPQFTQWTYLPISVDAATVLVEVPVTVTPSTFWQVTCVRTGYQAAESAPSNTVEDNGALPPIYRELVASPGSGMPVVVWTTVTQEPIKRMLTDDGPLALGSGFPVARWVTNGQDILNP